MPIELIDESFLDSINTECDLTNAINQDLLKNSVFGKYLRNFALLNYFPEKFSQDKLTIYYNKYYWYLKFMVEHRIVNGYDAGIEQQRFMIIEEGDHIPDIDWKIMEAITNHLTGEPS